MWVCLVSVWKSKARWLKWCASDFGLFGLFDCGSAIQSSWEQEDMYWRFHHVPPFHAILRKAHSGNAAVPRVIPRSVLQVEELEGQIEQQKRQGTQYELASRMMCGWWVYSKIHRTFLETMVFNQQLWDSGSMLSGVVCCCSPIFPSSHGFPWDPVPCPGAVRKPPGSILRSSFGNWFAKIPIRREWGCKIMQNHYTTCSLDSIAR